jgi:uncharacterized protein
MAAALVDTGFIVAYLDRDDKWHAECVSAFNAAKLPLLTTEAVLGEVFHLVQRDFGRADVAWGLLNTGAVTLAPIVDADLGAIRELMFKYHDRPMDFADATLVHLANRESMNLILTIDHNDFETYRLAGNRKFTILPRRRAR